MHHKKHATLKEFLQESVLKFNIHPQSLLQRVMGGTSV
jgi:hypothetical protein